MEELKIDYTNLWKYERPKRSHKKEDKTLKVECTYWGHGDYYPTKPQEEKFLGYDKERDVLIDIMDLTDDRWEFGFWNEQPIKEQE